MSTTTSTNTPTHSASVKVIDGSQTKFERIGVAWENDEGKICLKLYGTQIVSGNIYINPVKDDK